MTAPFNRVDELSPLPPNGRRAIEGAPKKWRVPGGNLHPTAILILALLVAGLTAFAGERLPVLKVDGVTYSNVTITGVTASDIFFLSDHGLANAKLKDLDPALQRHFHYNAAASAPEQSQGLFHFKAFSALHSDARPASIAAVKARMDDAIARVKAIVNQPVRSIPRTPDMQVATYHPGWFHPGAEVPDFNTVDVRATQKLSYARYQYVTSDLNPGVVFLGSELEFNPMTKYFYTDRSLPKAKLTEAEMLEINRLYRIIGKCQQQLNELQNPHTPLAAIYPWVARHKPIVIAGFSGLLVILLFVRRQQSQGFRM